MAHELAFENGKAQMFSVIQTPWHKEGILLLEHPSYKAALEAANFNYPLEKRPWFRPNPDSTTGPMPGWTESGDSFYVYRPDTKKTLGSVGGSYEIVTNEEAFAPLEPLVDAGVLKLETGGVLRDGADAWLLGRWDLSRFGSAVQEVFGNEMMPFATVMANHNGRRGIMLGETVVRIVCANTLGAAEVSGVKRFVTIDHKAGAKVRMVEVAEQLFSGVLERYEIVARQYKLLKECILSREAFQKLVLDIVAPDPRKDPKFNPDAKLAGTVLERAMMKRATVTKLWHEGKGHTGEENAWYAYNGAVEALDFNRDLWPTRAGSWRTASMLNGHLAQMKNAVLDGLVEFAMGA